MPYKISINFNWFNKNSYNSLHRADKFLILIMEWAHGRWHFEPEESPNFTGQGGS